MKKRTAVLGMNLLALSQLNSKMVTRLKMISSIDFTQVRKRLLVDFPDYTAKDLDEMEIELKRFLSLILLGKNIGHRIVLGEKVDALWHYFVLNTKEYRDFCQKVYENYVNHFPMLPSQKNELESDYKKTCDLYSVYFGKAPKKFWGKNQQICWGETDTGRCLHKVA